MRHKVIVVIAAVTLMLAPVTAQDSGAVLDSAAKALGAASLKSLQYSGSGLNFALGQSPEPTAPWPRFNVKSYTCAINYDTAAWRQEMVRTQGEDPPRGGGGQPLAGEQRQVQLVSGSHAWNMAGTNATPAPAARAERMLQIWVTPHGFVKGAMANKATVQAQTSGGKKVHVATFMADGRYRVRGVINDQGLVEKVETWIDNPVLGDMLVETTYSDYKDFGGVKFPTKIVQNQGGFPALDLTVTSVQPNAAADIQAPENVRMATAPPVTVETQKVADGVWYLTGGSHHSAAVEFNDHVVVIEGPQNEARSLAVIAEVKKLVPGKPIRYLVNTHHHFDHSGGIRTYVAEGATIVTHRINRPFYEKTFAAPRTLAPDALSKSGKKPAFQVVDRQWTMTDGARTLALYHIEGNAHNEGILMAYLPAEKILIEADVFTPGAPNAPPPQTANPFSVNLYENIQRLKLDVGQIVPIHGRLVTLADLQKAIKKASN